MALISNHEIVSCTVNVEVEPGAVLVRVGRAVEEDHLALVPALVTLLDVGQVETGEAVRTLSGHPRHSALVALTAVRRVAVVPDVDGNLQALLGSQTSSTRLSPRRPHHTQTPHAHATVL